MDSPAIQKQMSIWAVLCVLVALILLGITFLDTAFAGEDHIGTGPRPYASADAVSFGLGGLRYFYQGEVLTGPHIGYPLVLATLALNTLGLWLVRGWNERVQRMLRVSRVTLLLTLGLGLPVLKVAEWGQNRMLSYDAHSSTTASPFVLNIVAFESVTTQTGQEGVLKDRLTLPNPTAWGLLGLAATGLAGLHKRKSPQSL